MATAYPHPPAARPAGAAAVVAAVVTAAAVLSLAGCAPGAGGRDTRAGSGEIGGTVTVFAAATLTDTFTEIGAEFEQAHPDTTVVFNFAGSSTLAQQLNEGAPADVFASAHPAPMRTVADGGVTSVTPVAFARADLVIAVAPGNPRGITGLADLTDPDLTVTVCAAQVPCGRAAEEALAEGGVRLEPATYDRDVRAALSKVVIGEADAALVYRADARLAGPEVTAVEFPESAAAINDLQISVLGEAANPTTATAFVDYVRAGSGTEILLRDGYLEPG